MGGHKGEFLSTMVMAKAGFPVVQLLKFCLCNVPQVLVGGGDIDIPLRVEHSTATYSWHFDQLYVSALLPIAKKLYLCKKHYFLGEDVLFYLF